MPVLGPQDIVDWPRRPEHEEKTKPRGVIREWRYIPGERGGGRAKPSSKVSNARRDWNWPETNSRTTMLQAVKTSRGEGTGGWEKKRRGRELILRQKRV